MNRLIIFTRYPVPGKTKTRLIPAVGPERAANIQREMTETTALTAREYIQEAGNCELEIWYYGGSEVQMVGWLGDDLRYVEQPDGDDLGNKMSKAFSTSLNDGASATVIIGSDCPSINTDILTSAFSALEANDLTLGPTQDGGYYLIGQSTHTPSLFENVDWGTDTVLRTTLLQADVANLQHSLLPKLRDVDTPDDLILLENSQPGSTVSVIIPALNEGKTIAEVITSAKQGNPHQIIVVDGGSTDDTADVAEASGARVIASEKGRARQLNAGAEAATGDILLFLHADTFLPDEYDKHIRTVLSREGTACGAFELKIDSNSRAFRLLEILVSFRSCVMCMPYGDQALFVRKDAFRAAAGFKDMRLMEDYDFVKRIRKHGNIVIADAAVRTSPRRWECLGILRTTLINQYLIAAYTLGASPDRLADIYSRAKGSIS